MVGNGMCYKIDHSEMKINAEFIIENVRCFRDRLRVPLRPITFLVGENSTGKTTEFLGCYNALCNLWGSIRMERSGGNIFNQDPFSMGSYGDIVARSRHEMESFCWASAPLENKAKSAPNPPRFNLLLSQERRLRADSVKNFIAFCQWQRRTAHRKSATMAGLKKSRHNLASQIRLFRGRISGKLGICLPYIDFDALWLLPFRHVGTSQRSANWRLRFAISRAISLRLKVEYAPKNDMWRLRLFAPSPKRVYDPVSD